ncbi:hypothetical protein FXO38_05521 [Capsicum annuum]|nr:hypothetical protein FXO37_29743 [Capsicum annuum]KAF3673770.1 hypothetical protein FXO38_05521 [Capsicum annuum]
MVGLVDSWCFCNGGGKSEKMKATIFSGKGPAMAHRAVSGTGFLIHRNLLLTTHVVLPSVAAAEAAEIRLQNGVAARLFPHRFFITSSVLDLTIVGLDVMDGDTNANVQQPHYLKNCSKPNLELGSAGFDVHGNLAFMVCDPMKLAKSPNSQSSSTSTPVGKNGNTQIQLLDINFPPRINIKAAGSPQHVRKTLSNSDDNCTNKAREENSSYIGQISAVPDTEVASTGSVNGAQSEVESSCCLIEVLEAQHEYSSDGETTMYSAETAESRNYPSPKGGRFQQVGRSQSCVNYNRWGPVSKNSAARRAMQVQKRNNMQG